MVVISELFIRSLVVQLLYILTPVRIRPTLAWSEISQSEPLHTLSSTFLRSICSIATGYPTADQIFNIIRATCVDRPSLIPHVWCPPSSPQLTRCIRIAKTSQTFIIRIRESCVYTHRRVVKHSRHLNFELELRDRRKDERSVLSSLALRITSRINEDR